MLSNIPTHLIAGPLGAGKTSLIRHLLAHKPAHERWAVLINEFGQIGVDQALLTTPDDGISLAEVPGGCLCCVNGVPFQIGLARLLRKARPDRLLIEPSGLGHPQQLLAQLAEPPWTGVLALQPGVLVLDAAALASGQTLPDSQQAALAEAGLLVLNKAEGLDARARALLVARLPQRPLCWTSQGQLEIAALPGINVQAAAVAAEHRLPLGAGPLPMLWTDPHQPICQIQDQAEGWSIGWRFHPSQIFARAQLQQWLAGSQWRRAKLVFNSDGGWLSGNALDGAPLAWQASQWREDSRLELIFAAPQDAAALQTGLLACRR